MEPGLRGGDVLLVKNTSTNRLVGAALCLSCKNDVLLSRVTDQGGVQFVTMRRYMSDLPPSRFIQCVWMDEWEEPSRTGATRSALQLSADQPIDDWLVYHGGVPHNDAMERWLWEWQNASLFRQMCVVCWAHTQATSRQWEWKVLRPETFEAWVRASSALKM